MDNEVVEGNHAFNWNINPTPNTMLSKEALSESYFFRARTEEGTLSATVAAICMDTVMTCF